MNKKPKKTNKWLREREEDGAIYAVVKYLRGKGWGVGVAGFSQIVRRPPLKYNFSLIFSFSGRPPKK